MGIISDYLKDAANQVSGAYKQGGIPGALGAASTGLRGLVPAIADAAYQGAAPLATDALTPAFKFAEGAAGSRPGELFQSQPVPSVAAAKPAAPAQTPLGVPRNVALRPAPEMPVNDMPGMAAPIPGGGGRTTIRVGPDGRRSIVVEGDPQAQAAAPVASVPSVASAGADPGARTLTMPGLVGDKFFKQYDEAQRYASPVYAGGVGPGYAMNAADAAAATNAAARVANDRYIADQQAKTAGNTNQVANLNAIASLRNADTLAFAASSNAQETGARIAKLGQETQDISERTKALQLTEAQKAQALKLQEQIVLEQDPKKQRALQNRLYAITGRPQPKFQVIEVPGVGADGITPIKTPYILDEEGNARPAVAPQGIGTDPRALAIKADLASGKLKEAEARARLAALGYK